MGFFDRIFGRKSRSTRRWSPAGNAKLESPGLLLLLNAPPALDFERVRKALAAIEPLNIAPKFTSRLADEGPQPEAGVVYGTIEFDSHVIDIVGLPDSLPEPVVHKTVGASHWSGEGRAAMENHVAHYVLNHHGGGATPLEKYIALYKLAAALGGDQLAGVLNDAAWTCAPAAVVREFQQPEFLKACREQLPPILFTGFIKFIDEDATWFGTKGQHLFGAPDFVMQGKPDEKPSDALDLFMNIFLYVIAAGRELKAGHTMQIANEIFLRFGELEEAHPHRDTLKGAGRTLTITRISKDDINKGE